jgi:hypothetical protein
MSERIAKHKQRLTETRQKLVDALQRIGERGDEQIYSDGAQWTLRQLAIHLALADKGHNQMVYRYSRGEPFIPDDYDIDRYNRSSVSKHATMTVADALASLAESRAAFLAWLDEQEDDSFLEMRGRHPARNVVSVDSIIKIMALHEAGHTKDIVIMLEREPTD